MMQMCEVIYGCERGAQLSAFLEGAMGHPCPCKVGATCPLLPASDVAVPAQREQEFDPAALIASRCII